MAPCHRRLRVLRSHIIAAPNAGAAAGAAAEAEPSPQPHSGRTLTDAEKLQLYQHGTWYAEHRLPIFGQLRPGGFKGGYATTYCGCLAAPIGVLCLVVYRVDLLRRSVWSDSVAGAV